MDHFKFYFHVLEQGLETNQADTLSCVHTERQLWCLVGHTDLDQYIHTEHQRQWWCDVVNLGMGHH